MESKCHFVANLPVRPKTQCKGFEAGLARLTTLKISHGFTSAEFATCCQFRAGSSFVLSCSHNTNDHPAISLFFSRWSCQSLQTALLKQGMWDPHRASQEYIIGPYFNWALSVNRFWLVRRFSLFHTATSSFLECTRAANLGSPSNVGVELCSAMAILKVRAPWFNSREVGNWNRHGLAKKEC